MNLSAAAPEIEQIERDVGKKSDEFGDASSRAIGVGGAIVRVAGARPESLPERVEPSSTTALKLGEDSSHDRASLVGLPKACPQARSDLS